MNSLRLSKNYKEFRTSCFRKNLYYDLFYQNLLDNAFEHLKDFINECLNVDNEQDVADVSSSSSSKMAAFLNFTKHNF